MYSKKCLCQIIGGLDPFPTILTKTVTKFSTLFSKSTIPYKLKLHQIPLHCLMTSTTWPAPSIRPLRKTAMQVLSPSFGRRGWNRFVTLPVVSQQRLTLSSPPPQSWTVCDRQHAAFFVRFIIWKRKPKSNQSCLLILMLKTIGRMGQKLYCAADFIISWPD